MTTDVREFYGQLDANTHKVSRACAFGNNKREKLSGTVQLSGAAE